MGVLGAGREGIKKSVRASDPTSERLDLGCAERGASLVGSGDPGAQRGGEAAVCLQRVRLLSREFECCELTTVWSSMWSGVV